MRAGVLLAQVVRVVGGHQRQSGLLRQAVQLRNEPAVLVQVVVLHFQKEVLPPQNVGVRVRQAQRVVVLVREQRLRNLAAQTRREADQPLGVPRQQIQVDARFVIEALQVSRGDQLDEVAIALLVLA